MDRTCRSPRRCRGSGDPALFLDDDDDDDGGDGVGDSDEESLTMIMGRWTFILSSKGDDGVEGVAKDIESSVRGMGLLERVGDKGGVDDGAVKYVVDEDRGCRIIGRSISLIPSIRRCSKMVSAISFCCRASLSNLQAVCRQCWKCNQVLRTRSLSPIRSMISADPSSLSANSHKLLASNSYTGDEGRGVEVADILKVISNDDETSRFGGRSTEIC